MTTQLEKILSVALLVPMDDPSSKSCRWGLPLMLWGKPGIGKSGRVNSAGKLAKLDVEVLYPGLRQPEDVGGLPIPDGTGDASMKCILPAIKKLNRVGKGVLFLDELTCAREAVQSAFLSVIYERIAGDTKIEPGVRIVGAGNDPKDAAGGRPLAPPLANRLCHFEVPPPTLEEWTTWLLQSHPPQETPIEEGESAVMESWTYVYPKWKGLALGYLRANKKEECLYNLPPTGNADRHKAWPSHRTWEFAMRAAATCSALGTPELQPELLTGCIGSAQAEQWLKWVKAADLPDPSHVLQHGWQPNKSRLDICYTVYTSVVAYALAQKEQRGRRQLALRCWELLQDADQAHKLTDLVLAPAQSLLRAGYGISAGEDMKKASMKLIEKLGKSGMANYAQAP